MRWRRVGLVFGSAAESLQRARYAAIGPRDDDDRRTACDEGVGIRAQAEVHLALDERRADQRLRACRHAACDHHRNQRDRRFVANSLSIFISGVIVSYGSSQSYSSLPADGATDNFGFVLQPQDFDNNPIAAGTNDPYANPILVNLAETGGSGHSTLVLNGNPVGATTVLTHSTDTLALRYDGLGAPGYTTLTTLGATGVASSSIRISPLYVASASTYFSAASLSFVGSGESALLTASEASAPGTVTYAATPSASCSGIATASISAANATVTSGGTAAAFGPCSVAISDGTSTVAVRVANTISGVPITINGFTLTTYTPADADGGVTVQYGSITVGPDGALWVWEGLTPAAGVGHVTRITTSGTMTQFPAPGVGSSGFGIAAGADGNLWFTVYNHDQVDRMTTAGGVTAFPAGGSNPKGITAGPDGNLWFQAINPVNAIGRITPAGVITMFPLPNTSGQPGGITAPDAEAAAPRPRRHWQAPRARPARCSPCASR